MKSREPTRIVKLVTIEKFVEAIRDGKYSRAIAIWK